LGFYVNACIRGHWGDRLRGGREEREGQVVKKEKKGIDGRLP